MSEGSDTRMTDVTMTGATPPAHVTPRVQPRKSEERTPQNLLPTLPVTPDSRECRPDLRRVSCETVAAVLDGQYTDLPPPLIFDCRYGYEFHGGHIRGAHHAPAVDEVARLVLVEPGNLANTALIFHCEFSQQRAPAMVKALRQRAAEQGVVLPPLYIMKGGYHDFFARRADLCEPQGYVGMHSAAHTAEFAAARHWSPRRSKRKRAKTWSRFGGSESMPGLLAPQLLASSWGELEPSRLRLPFAEEHDDALWKSLDLW